MALFPKKMIRPTNLGVLGSRIAGFGGGIIGHHRALLEARRVIPDQWGLLVCGQHRYSREDVIPGWICE